MNKPVYTFVKYLEAILISIIKSPQNTDSSKQDLNNAVNEARGCTLNRKDKQNIELPLIDCICSSLSTLKETRLM